jgi:MFS superfamily sulfate permease-like transporter
MRDWFTLHSIIYRLILGAVVLAVVIPVWVSGDQPMWPIALITIFVVTAAGVLLARQPRLRDWLRSFLAISRQ